MGFSYKASENAKKTGSSSSSVDWDAFNEHKQEQLGLETDSRVAILSGIIDAGVQKRNPYEEKYEGTDEQEKKLKNGSYLSDDGKTILTDQKPVSHVIFIADFPEIMINYGKFFSKDGEDDWKPYREIIGGENWDKVAQKQFARAVGISCIPDDKVEGGWAYSHLSMVSKLAKATGCVPNGSVSQNFDLGDMLGGCFSVEIKVTESKGNYYYGVDTKTIGKKHKAIPVPKHDIKSFGIMFDEENDEESLRQIRNSMKNTLEMALNWPDSALKKQLEDLYSGNSSKEEEEEEDDQNDTPKAKKPAPKEESNEPEEEEDDTPKAKPKAKPAAKKVSKSTTDKKDPPPF